MDKFQYGHLMEHITSASTGCSNKLKRHSDIWTTFPTFLGLPWLPIHPFGSLPLAETRRSYILALYWEATDSNHAGTSCKAFYNVCCSFFTLCWRTREGKITSLKLLCFLNSIYSMSGPVCIHMLTVASVTWRSFQRFDKTVTGASKPFYRHHIYMCIYFVRLDTKTFNITS